MLKRGLASWLACWANVFFAHVGMVQVSLRGHSPRRCHPFTANVGSYECSRSGQKWHHYELCTSGSSPIALAQIFTHNLRDELQWQVFHPVGLSVYVSAVFPANAASRLYQGSV